MNVGLKSLVVVGRCLQVGNLREGVLETRKVKQFLF